MKKVVADYDSIRLYARELNNSYDDLNRIIKEFNSKTVNFEKSSEVNPIINNYVSKIKKDLDVLDNNLYNWVNNVLLKAAEKYESIDTNTKAIDCETAGGLAIIDETKLNSIISSADYKYSYLIDTSKYNKYLKQFGDSKYAVFRKVLTNEFIAMPSTAGYVPQGCCQAGNYYVMTAYDSNKVNKTNIYVFDKSGKIINTVTMDGKYHAGSVTYDSNTNTVYVPAGNAEHSIKAFKLNDLINTTGEIKGETISGFNANLDTHSVSYATVSDGKIYVGEYGTTKKNYQLESYQLNSTGGIIESTKKTYKVPYQHTQGMTVYNYKGKDYYLFSCSAGKKSSTIYVSQLSGNTFKTVKTITAPQYIENVSVTNKNNILVNFESMAKTDKISAKKVSTDAMILNLSKIL